MSNIGRDGSVQLTTSSVTPVEVMLAAGRTATALAAGGFDSFAIVRP